MAGGPIGRIAAALAVAPYVAIAIVLRGLPLPWPAAIGNAALLLALMAAHAWCYRLWQPRATGRILVNELGFPVALSSWMIHRRLVRRGYGIAQNVAHLGTFLLLLGTLLVVAAP